MIFFEYNKHCQQTKTSSPPPGRRRSGSVRSTQIRFFLLPFFFKGCLRAADAIPPARDFTYSRFPTNGANNKSDRWFPSAVFLCRNAGLAGATRCAAWLNARFGFLSRVFSRNKRVKTNPQTKTAPGSAAFSIITINISLCVLFVQNEVFRFL